MAAAVGSLREVNVQAGEWRNEDVGVIGRERRNNMDIKWYRNGGLAVRVTGPFSDGSCLPEVALNRWFYRWETGQYIADTDKATLVFNGQGLEIRVKGGFL